MALQGTFRELDDRVKALREVCTDLRVSLQEDGPQRGAPLLVDQLGDAATDLLGLVEEAAEASAEALRQASRPRDLEAVQEGLLQCHERLHQAELRFAADLLCCERLEEIHALGRERGRPWTLWADTLAMSLGQGQAALLAATGAVLDGWKEISDRTGAPNEDNHRKRGGRDGSPNGK